MIFSLSLGCIVVKLHVVIRYTLFYDYTILHQVAKRKVILTPIEGKKTDAISATADSKGKFCFQVHPGTYHVQVSISRGQRFGK